ncbi:NDP-hexose 2,3-dehydratase family protein [Micromonospora sp. NBC_01655]|uniref:NDP-hexose 2,3-dehydratase family protein n=1 Tax=Micromonospora sp. NBC_01655 TaxID=2975983 RepID=UPI002254591F|nr:NDP-hexose 2,3-dehydratase family protein [Micromonospora sp. NBC_01655]MCX4469513.1 NDP-hexose 2,3-dehydratase family protein [Micromonospora sp. NBC_01655]
MPELVAPSAGPSPVRPRSDAALPDRIATSAATPQGALLSTEDFADWLAGRGRANQFRVDRIPFAELQDWSFDGRTGNLGHRSGRFFTVEGLHATVDGPPGEWHQPIIRQPEVGILGILAKEFDGVLHFLMQAKMEPGNPNLLQLSPTVQATRSNYSKVHKGADVRYIEYFTRGLDRRRVLADALQSEHGSWFYHKSNRNMVVEVTEDVPLHDGFCWLTLGQIATLLRLDNVVNMDSRTVLACLPFTDRAEAALHSDTELLSWFTAQRAGHDVRATPVPLAGLPGWVRDEYTIAHEQERYFKVVAVSVVAGNREVTRWTQPLFEPCGTGVTAFLSRRIGGVRHVLAHARVEGGFLDTVELGPTVQCTPGNYAHLGDAARPPFLDLVLGADPASIRYEARHSEEGGRFLNAESRYLVVDVAESQVPLDPPAGYLWVTPGQLTSLVRHNHYVNVQARTLLACLNAIGDD